MSNASGASSLHKSVLAFGNTELEKNVLGTEEVTGGGVNSPKLEVVSCAPTPDEESDARYISLSSYHTDDNNACYSSYIQVFFYCLNLLAYNE